MLKDGMLCVHLSNWQKEYYLATLRTESNVLGNGKDCIGQVDGAFLPAEDCRKFIRCANGHPYEMSCPEGLAWDVKEKTCN